MRGECQAATRRVAIAWRMREPNTSDRMFLHIASTLVLWFKRFAPPEWAVVAERRVDGPQREVSQHSKSYNSLALAGRAISHGRRGDATEHRALARFLHERKGLDASGATTIAARTSSLGAVEGPRADRSVCSGRSDQPASQRNRASRDLATLSRSLRVRPSLRRQHGRQR